MSVGVASFARLNASLTSTRCHLLPEIYDLSFLGGSSCYRSEAVINSSLASNFVKSLVDGCSLKMNVKFLKKKCLF